MSSKILRSHRTFGYVFLAMSIRRVINYLLVSLLTTCLLASSASASSYAWCLCADGEHSALEFAPTGDRSQDDHIPTTADVATLGFEAGMDVCGPCQDVSFSPHWRAKRSRVLNAKFVLPPPSADQAVATLSLVNSQILPGQFSSPPPPRIPESILLHRTVVLLI